MNWNPKVRNYKTELNGKHCSRREVSDHPLKPFIVSQSETKKVKQLKTNNKNISNNKSTKDSVIVKQVNTSWNGLDPLSVAMNLHSDPIIKSMDSSVDFEKPSKSSTKENVSSNGFIGEDFESWSSMRTSILNKYTTSERLSIKTSFLVGGNSSLGMTASNTSVRTLQNTSVADKVKHRLEQLDDFEEGSLKEMLNLTQHEYVNRIEELNVALHDSWDSDQRVKALKIAIQCSKLLADVSVIQFYPSKFVLITDILDNFGSLVYKRIHCKAGFTSAAIESARETCRNWFYKIASVRELIPRFYVETAILKVYGFLIDEKDVDIEYDRALKRLTKMIRGIGDPLVAVYARAYLCRIIIEIAPHSKILFQNNFNDFLESLNQLSCTFVQQTLASQRIDYSIYYTLFTPALDWILYCIAYKASPALLNETLVKFKQNSSVSVEDGCSALILNSLLTCFPPEFIASRALEFLELVKKVNKDVMKDNGNTTICTSVYPKYILIRNLGLSLVSSDNLWIDIEEKEKLVILNEVWKIINKFKSNSEYMSCVEVWIEFVVKHFRLREINTLLGDIIKHMLPDRTFEQHYSQLVALMSKVVTFSPNGDFAALFAINNFMPFLDLLQKESVKVDACKVIVDSFIKNFSQINVDNEEDMTTSDPVILNSMTYLCKTMHDSVNALTLEDERRQISSLVISFLKRVSFNRDFESQLNFYVDSRANFNNLETVLCFLVQRVNALAMETRRIVKGYHTKKTTSFVRACIAYSFITIPSLDDVIMRLQLYISSSYVALINGCLPQTDSFMKTAITLIQQLPTHIESSDGRPKSTEPFLTSYVSQLLSFLLLVPDNPEQESLYLLKGLLNVLNERQFDNNSDNKALIYMNVLNFLSAASQESYPYHISKVDSNDTLYGNDSKFMEEIKSLSSTVLSDLLEYMKKLGDEKQYKRQASLALDLFNRIISHGNAQSMYKLLLNLWQLSQKNSVLDNKRSSNALNYLRKKANESKSSALLELSSKLENK